MIGGRVNYIIVGVVCAWIRALSWWLFLCAFGKGEFLCWEFNFWIVLAWAWALCFLFCLMGAFHRYTFAGCLFKRYIILLNQLTLSDRYRVLVQLFCQEYLLVLLLMRQKVRSWFWSWTWIRWYCIYQQWVLTYRTWRNWLKVRKEVHYFFYLEKEKAGMGVIYFVY